MKNLKYLKTLMIDNLTKVQLNEIEDELPGLEMINGMILDKNKGIDL